MYEKKLETAYLREMMMGFALYVALLVASITFGRAMDEGVLRLVVLLSPVLGLLAIGWALARHARRVDEFMRKEGLESIAIAALLTAGITFTYGFLETAGLPKLSMFYVLPLMGSLWGIVGCARALQNHE